MTDTVFGLGIDTRGLDDSDMVTDVVVIAKVIDLTGDDPRPSVCVFHSGVDWLTQVGLLEIARSVVEEMDGDDE